MGNKKDFHGLSSLPKSYIVFAGGDCRTFKSQRDADSYVKKANGEFEREMLKKFEIR